MKAPLPSKSWSAAISGSRQCQQKGQVAFVWVVGLQLYLKERVARRFLRSVTSTLVQSGPRMKSCPPSGKPAPEGPREPRSLASIRLILLPHGKLRSFIRRNHPLRNLRLITALAKLRPDITPDAQRNTFQPIHRAICSPNLNPKCTART